MCVLMLLYMCPDTHTGDELRAAGVFSLHAYTTIYVSSCYDICVLMLLYMCPDTHTGDELRAAGVFSLHVYGRNWRCRLLLVHRTKACHSAN
jgi:hypothetical protein